MTSHHAARRDVTVARSMRVIMVAAAVLVFLAGFQLTVFPTRTAEWFSWTIDVPMTAVFLGAAYWSSAVLEIAGARAGTWGRARIAVWTVLVFTVLTFVVTMVHLDKFHLGADQPASARGVAWGWLAIYAGVPLAMVLALAVQTRRGTPVDDDVRRPLPRLLRTLLALLGLGLLAAGITLLLDPGRAAQGWSWPLTPLTARAIGAWLVGLGWAAAHACLLGDAERVRPLGWTGAAFVILEMVAVLRHGDALDWSGWQTFAYLGGLAWIALVAGWVLVLRAADAGEPGSSR